MEQEVLLFDVVYSTKINICVGIVIIIIHRKNYLQLYFDFSREMHCDDFESQKNYCKKCIILGNTQLQILQYFLNLFFVSARNKTCSQYNNK